MNRCRLIPASRNKSETAVKRRFLPFLKSSKGHFWPFFATLLKDMERGGSYTYSTKILPTKPLTLETYYKKQSARMLAYLCVIFYQVYSPNVSGLRYWRSCICFWTHLVCPRFPFTLSTITYKVVVYAPAERADTHPLFLLYPCMCSVDMPTV